MAFSIICKNHYFQIVPKIMFLFTFFNNNSVASFIFSLVSELLTLILTLVFSCNVSYKYIKGVQLNSSGATKSLKLPKLPYHRTITFLLYKISSQKLYFFIVIIQLDTYSSRYYYLHPWQLPQLDNDVPSPLSLPSSLEFHCCWLLLFQNSTHFAPILRKTSRNNPPGA